MFCDQLHYATVQEEDDDEVLFTFTFLLLAFPFLLFLPHSPLILVLLLFPLLGDSHHDEMLRLFTFTFFSFPPFSSSFSVFSPVFLLLLFPLLGGTHCKNEVRRCRTKETPRQSCSRQTAAIVPPLTASGWSPPTPPGYASPSASSSQGAHCSSSYQSDLQIFNDSNSSASSLSTRFVYASN